MANSQPEPAQKAGESQAGKVREHDRELRALLSVGSTAPLLNLFWGGVTQDIQQPWGRPWADFGTNNEGAPSNSGRSQQAGADSNRKSAYKSSSRPSAGNESAE